VHLSDKKKMWTLGVGMDDFGMCTYYVLYILLGYPIRIEYISLLNITLAIHLPLSPAHDTRTAHVYNTRTAQYTCSSLLFVSPSPRPLRVYLEKTYVRLLSCPSAYMSICPSACMHILPMYL
jgi:hypothetical protein